MSEDSDSDNENFIRNVRLLDAPKPKSKLDPKDYTLAFVILLIHSIFSLFMIFFIIFFKLK